MCEFMTAHGEDDERSGFKNVLSARSEKRTSDRDGGNKIGGQAAMRS